MASFSQNIPAKYGVKSYQDTKNTYDWIMKSLNNGAFESLRVQTTFQFDISGMSCVCEGVEEFIDRAYGLDGYDFTRMTFYVYSDATFLAYISVYLSVKYGFQVKISTDTKILLEKIVGLLKDTSLSNAKTGDSVPATYPVTHIEYQDNRVTVSGNSNVIANNHSAMTDKLEPPESESAEGSGHQNNSVIIDGNRNVVTNNHSIITDKQKSSESKISKWFQGVGQGLFANLLWWILGLVAVAILSWAVSKGYISIH